MPTARSIGRGGAVAAAVFAASCSLPTPTPLAMGVGPSESFRVGYLVRCRECRVFYTAGREREVVEVKGSWSRTVRIRDADTRFVRLVATPSNVPGYIEHAYIEVDGTKLAEERRSSSSAGSDEVTLSAPLTRGR